MPGTFLGLAALAGTLLLPSVRAQEAELNAATLSARLSEAVQDNASTVRLKLETNPAAGGEKVVLQLQAKARRTPAATDILYQVLWPKERKGEGFVLRKAANQAASGSVFLPPDAMRTLAGAQMKDGIFGSALSYEDLVDNFYAWPSQQLVGTEVLNRVTCQILESKPGQASKSSYTSVRSWIDVKRMVPIRIEKYGSGGQVLCRIITTRVAKDDANRQVPASFTVQRAGQQAVTVLEGSNSRHDVTFTDADFSPATLRAQAGQASKND